MSSTMGYIFAYVSTGDRYTCIIHQYMHHTYVCVYAYMYICICIHISCVHDLYSIMYYDDMSNDMNIDTGLNMRREHT